MQAGKAWHHLNMNRKFDSSHSLSFIPTLKENQMGTTTSNKFNYWWLRETNNVDDNVVVEKIALPFLLQL